MFVSVFFWLTARAVDARAHTAENITKWTKEALEAIGLTAERLMGAAAE